MQRLTLHPILDEIRARPDPDDPESSVLGPKSRPKRHGGPRPNSGPPNGNLNGLKHGLYSRRHKQLLEALLEVPETRQALIDIGNRNRECVRKAELEATYLPMRWLANHNPEGLTAVMDGTSFNIQSENDQARIHQMDKALAGWKQPSNEEFPKTRPKAHPKTKGTTKHP